MMYDRDKRVIEWLCTGNVGISSQTLCGCLYGIPSKNKFQTHPSDPCDFSRCKRFLEVLDLEEKKTALQVAAKISPQWKALVGRWDDLEWMHDHRSGEDMFAEMRKIIREAQ